MKTNTFKELQINRSTISNLQETTILKARSWGYSCFTTAKNNL